MQDSLRDANSKPASDWGGLGEGGGGGGGGGREERERKKKRKKRGQSPVTCFTRTQNDSAELQPGHATVQNYNRVRSLCRITAGSGQCAELQPGQVTVQNYNRVRQLYRIISGSHHSAELQPGDVTVQNYNRVTPLCRITTGSRHSRKTDTAQQHRMERHTPCQFHLTRQVTAAEQRQSSFFD